MANQSNQSTHSFILSPGHWIGKGIIGFSSSPDRIPFYLSWIIEKGEEEGVFIAKQSSQMQASTSQIVNTLKIHNITPHSFAILAELQFIGSTTGRGIIDATKIAWEYRDHQNFEGFEVYELQENGDYSLHAEYSSSDQFRTIIEGSIWRKKDEE